MFNIMPVELTMTGSDLLAEIGIDFTALSASFAENSIKDEQLRFLKLCSQFDSDLSKVMSDANSDL